METNNDVRGSAGLVDVHHVHHKLTQLCSLLAVLRMPSVVQELTEETQTNVLWLAHDLSLEAKKGLSHLPFGN